MAFSIYAEIDGVTVGTTEVSIINGNTTPASATDDGVYSVWVDLSAMAKGDVFKLLIYEKVEETGGTQRVFDYWTFMGVQSSNHCTPHLILMLGWDARLVKLAGTDRALDATIRRVF